MSFQKGLDGKILVDRIEKLLCEVQDRVANGELSMVDVKNEDDHQLSRKVKEIITQDGPEKRKER